MKMRNLVNIVGVGTLLDRDDTWRLESTKDGMNRWETDDGKEVFTPVEHDVGLRKMDRPHLMGALSAICWHNQSMREIAEKALSQEPTGE